MHEPAPMVLVVDDDLSMRKVLCRWLERGDFRTVSAGSAEEAFDILLQVIPDAICLDLGLPGMDGLTALERIKHTHPTLPVVVMTGEAEPATIVSAMQKGAFDYLVKPSDATRVLTSLGHATERYRMMLAVASLEREARADDSYQGMFGRSAPMKALFRTLDRVADRDVTVMLHGESGTGKELVARAIHERSARAKGPFVAVNCASVPESLQEAELFGHERGAFTGAANRRAGLFERAHGGTLFLDELAELGTRLQAQLLRVLEERSFTRLGGSDVVRTNFRLITASHADLEEAVRAGRFREDLFFRVAVFEIDLPPLRERGDDVVLLAKRFAEERESAVPITFAEDALAIIRNHPWPGNVRELRNAIERALVVCDHGVIRAENLPARLRAEAARGGLPPVASELDAPATLEGLERQALVDALERHDWQVNEVVRELAIGRTTVYRKIKEYGLVQRKRD